MVLRHVNYECTGESVRIRERGRRATGRSPSKWEVADQWLEDDALKESNNGPKFNFSWAFISQNQLRLQMRPFYLCNNV